MKKITAALLCLLLLSAALSGCGKGGAEAGGAGPSGIASPRVSYPVQLGKTQLGYYEALLNADGGYGFLLSDYDDVTGADLAQVLYLGAGMAEPDNRADIISAAEAARGETPDCDATVLTKGQINDFLLAKTGHTLADMTQVFPWQYVAEYDAYVHFHGDTNKVTVSVDDGNEISENTYVLNYSIPGGVYGEDGNLFGGGAVTVKASSAVIQFLSNKLRPE